MKPNQDPNENMQKKTFSSVEDGHLYANYQKIKSMHAEDLRNSAVSDLTLLRHEAPKLDLRVRILFEENLNTLVFPKVKEFLFRVSRSSPLEVAAKILANKNMHSHKWKDYNFSQISLLDSKETRYEDLATSFSSLMTKESSIDAALDEIILFYRVRDLEQFSSQEGARRQAEEDVEMK